VWLLGRAPVPEPEPGVPPVSWHVGLGQISWLLQPQVVMCPNCGAAGLGFDLRARDGSSYQADGVWALKHGQSVTTGNFRSGHRQEVCTLLNIQPRMTSSFAPSTSSV